MTTTQQKRCVSAAAGCARSMNGSQPTFGGRPQDIGDLFSGLNDVLITLVAALEKKGVLTRPELRGQLAATRSELLARGSYEGAPCRLAMIELMMGVCTTSDERAAAARSRLRVVGEDDPPGVG